MEMRAPARVFDPETIALLQSVLEDAWASLPVREQVKSHKVNLAERILCAAGKGERDPRRLRAAALVHAVPDAALSDLRAVALSGARVGHRPKG